jgi:hypothetical protein
VWDDGEQSMTKDIKWLGAVDRRALLIRAGGVAASLVSLELFAQELSPETKQGREVIKEIADLKPGEFTWHPDRQPTGPVAVVVSLPQQLVHVYRNGVRIAVSTCSTGRPGHSTPTGVFVVLEKDKNHHSSTYNNAPMPNMNRLTWSGIALHAGQLPGYPASHGCVRLPLSFSAKLFTVTHLGTPVIIASAHGDPWELTHPGMVMAGYAQSEFREVEATLEGKKRPSDWAESETAPIISVVASSSDKKIMVIENGDVIAEGDLALVGDGPLGSHVLVLQGAHGDGQGMRWLAVTHNVNAGSLAQPDLLLQRLTASPAVMDTIKEKMHPGMVVVLTDTPLHPDTRSGKDFLIMS